MVVSLSQEIKKINTAINQYGCASEPITQDITVLIGPLVNAGNDTTLCHGDTLLINATTNAATGYSLAWTPTTTMLNAGSITPSVFPSTTTTYAVEVNSGLSCIGKDSIKVTISQPSVSASPLPTVPNAFLFSQAPDAYPLKL